MSKELKLLLISLALILLGIIALQKHPVNCWDKYATEALAIQMCEGK